MSRGAIKRVIVIGCGIHYREKYHAVLERKGIEIALLIDLKSKENIIRAFISQNKLKPKQYLFLDETYCHTISIDNIDALVAEKDLSEVDGVLICTEPKVKKSYAVWTAKHGWDLFIDKPITAFCSLDQVDALESDFDEIITAFDTNGAKAVVSCERRTHLGYVWLKKYIEEFILEHQAPLTSIDIHFAGGVLENSARIPA